MPDSSRHPIDMSRPLIREEDVRAVEQVVRSGRLALGPVTEAFERRMAEYLGARHAVAVSSGTAGLHLSVVAAGIGDGDEVVTTPFSFIASTSCILFERALPRFVDVEPQTGNIDPARIEAAITPRTRAILTVDIFGQPADADPIRALAERHGLVVIEDACEALGAEYKGRRAGTLGDLATLGFYPNKQLTAGEGGMVLTDRDDWADLLRSLRNQGRDVHDGWLAHSRLGFNYRLDEMSAALGLSQLGRVDELLAQRARVAALYDERLRGVDGVETPRVAPTTTRMSWYGYIVRVANRDAVARALAEEGIPTRVYFPPLHLQPALRARLGHGPGAFPVTESIAARVLALPFHGELTAGEVERVAAALERALS